MNSPEFFPKIHEGGRIRRNDVGGSVMGTVYEEALEEKVILTTTPKVEWACMVFDDDEMDARLDRYADRAEKRLPLFHDGPPEPEDENRPGVARCDGCRVKCSRQLLVDYEGLDLCPRCGKVIDTLRTQGKIL